MWAVPCAALLMTAGGLDVHATVAAEARAGEMPVQAGETSRAFTAGLVTPLAELELRAPDLDLRLGYGPRVFWQDPTVSGAEARPLLLHLASASAVARPSPRATVTVRLAGSAGEADYSLLPQLFGTGQAALPGTLKILTGDAGADLRFQASRRWRCALGARISHRQPLGDTAPAGSAVAPPPPFPDQTVAVAEPSVEYRLTRRDDLIVAAPALYGNYSGGVKVVTVAPTIGWRGRVAAHGEVELALGIAGGRDLGPAVAAGSAVSPVGSARFDAAELRAAGVPWHASAAVGVEYVVDPILRSAGRRGVVSARLLAAPANDWTAGAEAMFATNLRASALPGEPDETAISVAVPVRHRLSDHLLLELGARATDRAPSLAASHFAFHQRQLWVYLTLVGASRAEGPWASP